MIKCFGHWHTCTLFRGVCTAEEHCESVAKGCLEIEWEYDVENKRATFHGKASLMAVAESDLDLNSVTRVKW